MSIYDTITEVKKESETGEIEPLIQLRETIKEIICECMDVKATGNSGCGGGYADVEFDLGDGLLFNVTVSMYVGDDEVEH
jgi:hypothetical protein